MVGEKRYLHPFRWKSAENGENGAQGRRDAMFCLWERLSFLFCFSEKITPTFSVSVTAAKLISDTKSGIERNDFFIVLKAEVFWRRA